MVSRIPLVLVSGLIAELPSGDSALAGTSATEIIAGSGLDGGGPLSSIPRLDVSLVPQPSGFIFVDGALANDGVALVSGEFAADVSYLAATNASEALSSGNFALEIAGDALASGNNALEVVKTAQDGGTRYIGVAGTSIQEGNPVGLNEAGQFEPLRRPNFIYKKPEASINSTFATNDYSAYYDLVYSPQGENFVFMRDAARPTVTTIDVSGNGEADIKPALNQFMAAVGISFVYGAYNKDRRGFSYVFRLDSNSDVYAVYFEYSTDNPTRLVEGTYTSIYTGTAQPYGVVHIKDDLFCVLYEIGSTNLAAQLYTHNTSYLNKDTTAYTIVSNGNTSSPKIIYDEAIDKIVVQYSTTYGTTQAAIYDYDEDSLRLSQINNQQIFNYQASQTALYKDKIRNRYVSIHSNQTDSRERIVPYYIDSDTYVISVPSSGTEFNEGQPFTVQNGDYDPVNDIYQTTGRGYGNFTVSRVFCPSGENDFFVSDSGTFYPISNPAAVVGKFHLPTAQLVNVYYQNSNRMTMQVGLPYFQGNNCLPLSNTQSNYVGLAASSVSSGDSVTVVMPGDQFTYASGNYNVGDFLYLDCINSGLRPEPNLEVSWSGQVNWAPVAQATSASGVVLINQL